MSVLTSLGILFSAMLIMAFLQFIPGLFALVCHHNYGKFSKIKASDLSIFFILGVETALVLLLLATYIVISAFSPLLSSSKILNWLAAGISIILALVFFFFYFKRGTGTRLFLSRSTVSKFRSKINSIKIRSDAFVLGFSSVLPEALFTAPLLVISVVQISILGVTPVTRAFLIILFAIIAILPLLIIHILFGTTHNLADFMRFRFKNKAFSRWIVTVLYLIIAVLFIMEAVS